MKAQGPQDRGQRGSSSHFAADKDKGITQTVGTNPNPPVKRSASIPASTVPPYPACLIGPYTGMSG